MTRVLCFLSVFCLLAAPLAAHPSAGESIPPPEAKAGPLLVPNG